MARRLASAMQDRYEQAEASGRTQQHLAEWDLLEGLIVWCRNAAALQPDGTKQPVLRCEVRLTSQAASKAPSWKLLHILFALPSLCFSLMVSAIAMLHIILYISCIVWQGCGDQSSP